jgi:hypothetical protein
LEFSRPDSQRVNVPLAEPGLRLERCTTGLRSVATCDQPLDRGLNARRVVYLHHGLPRWSRQHRSIDRHRHVVSETGREVIAEADAGFGLGLCELLPETRMRCLADRKQVVDNLRRRLNDKRGCERCVGGHEIE